MVLRTRPKRFQLIADLRPKQSPRKLMQSSQQTGVQQTHSQQSSVAPRSKRPNFFRRIWESSKLRKTVISLAASSALASSVFGSYFSQAAESKVENEKTHIVNKNRGIIRAPKEMRGGVVYDPNAPGRCSAYANRVAKILGLIYARADAWDLSKVNKIVFSTLTRFNKNKLTGSISWNEMQSLIKSEKVKEGTLIGIYVPNSRENNAERPYTHVGVVSYVGGELSLLHNFPSGIKVVPLEELCKNFSTGATTIGGKASAGKMYPVEILAPKN